MTIEDVVFVIDSGKAKEKAYDPLTSVSTLQTKRVARASPSPVSCTRNNQ